MYCENDFVRRLMILNTLSFLHDIFTFTVRMSVYIKQIKTIHASIETN